MKIYAAPLQGYTEAPWRLWHHRIFGGVEGYYTPFLRVEGGVVRGRDLRDAVSPLNSGVPVVPQIIFRDAAEFGLLVDCLVGRGFSEIDLNLGCPFVPQARRGRGCGAIVNIAMLKGVSELIRTKYGEVTFSLKMRLGAERPDEWRQSMDVINGMRLRHVTVHPRFGRQQYRGELDMAEFGDLYAECGHPVIFNGEITAPAQIAETAARFPGLAGVMVGRGLLARPSLAAEYVSGHEWPDGRRLAAIMELHEAIIGHYRRVLCGDAQVLSKIKPFWDYLEPSIGHRAAKAIKKATTLAAYTSIVNAMGSLSPDT